MLSTVFYNYILNTISGFQFTLPFFCFTLLLGAFFAICLNTRTYIYVLICLEIAIVLTSAILMLLSFNAVNNVAITFFLLLIAAGETTLLLSIVVATSEAYRFIVQTNQQKFFV